MSCWISLPPSECCPLPELGISHSLIYSLILYFVAAAAAAAASAGCCCQMQIDIKLPVVCRFVSFHLHCPVAARGAPPSGMWGKLSPQRANPEKASTVSTVGQTLRKKKKPQVESNKMRKMRKRLM